MVAKLQVSKIDELFGPYAFDAFEFPVIQRRKFAPVPEKYQGIDASATAGTRISKHFTIADFTAAPNTNTKLAHASLLTPDQTLRNLQQMAVEIDSMVDYVGAKPIVTHGLASINTNPDNYNPTTTAKTYQGGTMFEAMLNGQAMGFRYKEDNLKKLELASIYIRTSVIYDRMILRYVTGIDEPVLLVSVTNQARRTFFTMQDKKVIGKGFVEIDG